MLTAAVHEYELPQELIRKARDIAVVKFDKGKGCDFDHLLRQAMHDLVIQACWGEYRKEKK